MGVVPVSPCISVMHYPSLRPLALDLYLSLRITLDLLPGYQLDLLDLNPNETHRPLAGVNGPPPGHLVVIQDGNTKPTWI